MGKCRALGLALLLSLGAGWMRAAWNPETGNYVFQIYPAGIYKAHPQNWAAVQDSRGLMYFGNTEGLLEYDGVTWRTIQLPRSSPVRSLATDRQGNVYVGGSGELGLLQDDRTGGRTYVSLLDRIPQDARKFASVWRILPAKEGVYFSSYQCLFLLQPDGRMRVFRPKKVFGQAFVFRDQLYVTTKEDGLQRLAFTGSSSSSAGSSSSPGYAFEKVPGGERFLKEDAISIIPDGASAVIASPSALFHLSSSGVTAFPTEADEYLQKNALYSMLRVPGDLIQIGTRRGGLVLLDAEGKLRRTITTHDGLPSNWVTAMGMDRQGSIWLTTDGGIVRFNPGLTRFGPSNGIEGKVLTIRRVGKDMYAGTTAGLFRMRPRENGAPDFEQVRGIETTQYTIVPNGFGSKGEEFLSGGLKGLWAVSHLKAKNILNTDVIYDASASLRDPRVIYAAGRAGLFRLRRENTGWVQTAHVPSSGEEFRVVLDDQEGKVWATAPGVVLRMDLEKKPPVIERFEAPPGIRTSVYRVGGGLIFATSKGVMRFSGGKLVPDPRFGTRAVSLVTEDNSGDANTEDTWVTGPGFHTVMRTRRNGSEWYPEPLIEAGIEEIYALALDRDHTCWAAGADSILYRWREPLAGDPNREFRVITRRVEPIGGKEPLRLPIQPIPHSENAIRFEFAAPFFESPAAVEYQVKLDGSDKEWSAWSPEAHKDYTNLFEHAYRFHVRARNPHGRQTEEATIDFRVKPPWFRTWFAYFFYAVGLAVAVWGMIRWRVRALEESNRRLEVIVDQRTAEVRQQRDQIAEEEKKTESLLLNILPAPVAAELRQTGSVTPMSFEDVTVCFTDFVGFTLSSEKLAAGRLVDALNEYFTCFDEIVGRYGLEKLKTIGDSYMFVSGLPEQRRSHAVDAVMAALEMVDAVKRIATRNGDVQWNIRIGLHSGPVVAGVVGVRKFAFDVWGDTVNFAARMESSGVPGKVNISSRTCRLLGGLIDCEARGMIRIKEGREMEMFLVRGPASHIRSEEEFRQDYEAEFGEEFRGPAGFLHRETVSARTA